MFPKIFSATNAESKTDDSTTAADVTDEQMSEGSVADPSTIDPPLGSPSKMERAVDVHRRMSRKKGTTRKEIVTAFMEEVGLTKAGAATYYQMIKKGRR